MGDPGAFAANRPRWRGQAGFFEIWFLVVFEPGAARAYWFRYTTFAPRGAGAARATLWAAAFQGPGRTMAVKEIHPIADYRAVDEPPRIQLGASVFGPARCQGQVADGGHSLSWDLQFTPAAGPARRAPFFFDHRLPLPTKVLHANSEVSFRGTVTVDGETRALERAIGVQKHLWGTRRVDELFWIYCPQFDEDPAARLEATAVRPRTHLGRLELPRLPMLWLQTAQGTRELFGARQLLLNRMQREGELGLRFRARSRHGDVEVEAACERETLVGYVYRDPAGHDLYVAQSDLAPSSHGA